MLHRVILGEVEVVGALRKRVLSRLIHEWIRRGLKSASIWDQVFNIKIAIDAKVWWEIHHLSVWIDLLEDSEWSCAMRM